MKNNENKIESRRSFLKKAAYAVPTVIAISQLTNPTSAEAFKRDSASNVNLVSANKASSGAASSQGISASSFSTTDK